MRRRWVWIAAALLVVVLIGPLLIPIPQRITPWAPSALASAESAFVPLNGVNVHLLRAPAAPEADGPPIVLLHGTGLSIYSWRHVQAPLAAYGEVFALDTPGFGLTERPLPPDLPSPHPYTLEGRVALLLALLDAEDISQAVLIGNSAGGQWATKFALTHPDRVAALVLVDAAVLQGGGTPSFVRPLLNTPQFNHLGPYLMRHNNPWGESFLRGLWYQPQNLPDAVVNTYQTQLRVGPWDSALWQIMQQSRPLTAAERDALPTLTMPTLIVNGAEDTLVPPAISAELAEQLPNATLAILPDCGHLPQEECPKAFLQAVAPFLTRKP